jgi:hypothetical protein
MAVPDKLYVPTGATYEVLASDPSNAANAVSFKYKFTDSGETIPAWFKVADTGESSGGTFTLAGDNSTITIDSGGSYAYWGKWGSAGSGDLDLTNRAALHSAMASGMFTELSVSADHTLRSDYTYKTVRADASSSNVKITLPAANSPQTIIRLVATCGSTTRVSIAPPADGYLNGVVDAGNNEADIALPLDWASDTPILITQDNESNNLGWRAQLPTSGDLSDSAPIASIRRMTQSAYDALGSTDPNTLYVIE